MSLLSLCAEEGESTLYTTVCEVFKKQTRFYHHLLKLLLWLFITLITQHRALFMAYKQNTQILVPATLCNPLLLLFLTLFMGVTMCFYYILSQSCCSRLFSTPGILFFLLFRWLTPYPPLQLKFHILREALLPPT